MVYARSVNEAEKPRHILTMALTLFSVVPRGCDPGHLFIMKTRPFRMYGSFGSLKRVLPPASHNATPEQP